LKSLIFGFCFLFALGAGAFAATSSKKDNKALFAQWARIRTPSAGATSPEGTYAAGCLAGAHKLNEDGNGFAVMRLSRHRNYGTPELLSYIETLSEQLREQKLPLLLVGDLGAPRGGPMATGHNSHQIGLDVDLWLMMSGKRPTLAQRESWSATSFVVKRKKLKSNWSATQTKLVATAANSESVNRIFVSPPIKRYFCKHFADAPWLYRLRAWWGHEEHIHVRLNCPSGSTSCVPQPPLNSQDNGCGSELEWWFSKEADADWKKIVNDRSERQFPDLPPACELVKDANPT
jgi:penicillin-insensitive murein endopeptidase